jgi:hypothetical protein
MQVSKFVAAALVAAVCSAAVMPAALAQSTARGASETSLLSGSVLIALPFILVDAASAKVVGSLSGLGDHTRWAVTDVKEQAGGKTEARMLSDDGKYKLTMTVDTPTVQAQRLAAGDKVDVDRVGTTGYTVRKGAATLGVLAQPGMAHSSARG